MVIASWLAGIARRAVVRSRLRCDYLLDADRLAHAVLCERSRVDRNGSVLSVLRSTDRLVGAPQANLDLASEQLQLRLRITDTVGFSRDGRLMVLLPDTPARGAQHVADDLQRILRTSFGDVEFEIATYPDDCLANDDSASGDASSDKLVTIDQRHASLVRAGDYPLTDRPTGAVTSRFASSEALLAWRCPRWKRAVDIVGASVGLVVAAPIVCTAAVLVRMSSPGGAFFVQSREGLGGKAFKIYKLRTMQSDAEAMKRELLDQSEQDGPAFKLTNDPRITPLGRVLRKTSIDELPQLWNVLRGDMSLVGPRPLPVDESQGCQPWQRRRLSVRPGLTCIWQIRGRNIVSFDEWVRMDLRYIKRRSLWYDLYLIAITAPAVVAKRGGR